MIAQELEVSLHMAFMEARQKRHEFITVEHLLLALLDNPSASEVLRACAADIEDLRKQLAEFVSEHTPILSGEEADTQPTLGFQRVIQRAILHVQSSGKKEVTGANVLVAIFGEKPNPTFVTPEPVDDTEEHLAGLLVLLLEVRLGEPIDRLLGYRWTGERFEQIPFQVDEVFTRHLSNNASGFSFYSGRDRHVSYAFDREGWRWIDSHPDDACRAWPASEIARDPVRGLDTDDELVFMARDLGPRAPGTTERPHGIDEIVEVVVPDPLNGTVRYAYVALAAEDGPGPAFDATNGYVRYERDAHADVFLFSQSSYSNYGNAPHGPWFDPSTGVCHEEEDSWRQRRPGDHATVSTPRYRFRYDGRWLMTEVRVSHDEDGD